MLFEKNKDTFIKEESSTGEEMELKVTLNNPSPIEESSYPSNISDMATDRS
jgi:hypothetical protein